MQGCPCRVSNNPNPFLSLRRGFNHSPTLANLWQGLKLGSAEAASPSQCFGIAGRRDDLLLAFALRVNLVFFISRDDAMILFICYAMKPGRPNGLKISEKSIRKSINPIFV